MRDNRTSHFDDLESEGNVLQVPKAPCVPSVFISAAEPSADAHAAALIKAVRERSPETQFIGVAGPAMVAAGCQCIFDMTQHSAMLLSAINSAGRAISMLRLSDRLLRMKQFAAAVVVDSPTLHLPLAARAQAAGVPVLYYIAPQMWAWGTYRIHKLRDRADQVAVILPFEEAFFRGYGINATYVGHPLAERLNGTFVEPDAVSVLRETGSPVVALLPGSRKHVVSEVLRGQLQVAERIAAAIPGAAFIVSVAGEQVEPIIRDAIRRCRARITAYAGQYTEVIRAADLVLVASGTAALEVAFHQRPMIVMYNTSRLFWHLLGRWMIHTRHLSLPNILADRQIVPEFMPYYTSIEPIVTSALSLLRSEPARQAQVAELTRAVAPLRNTRASENTAELLIKMIRQSCH